MTVQNHFQGNVGWRFCGRSGPRPVTGRSGFGVRLRIVYQSEGRISEKTLLFFAQGGPGAEGHGRPWRRMPENFCPQVFPGCGNPILDQDRIGPDPVSLQFSRSCVHMARIFGCCHRRTRPTVWICESGCRIRSLRVKFL